MKKIDLHMGKLGTNPSFDWYFSLACFVVALLVVAALDLWLYESVAATDPSSGTGAVSSKNILNKKDIGDMADKIRHADAVSSALSISDPSL